MNTHFNRIIGLLFLAIFPVVSSALEEQGYETICAAPQKVMQCASLTSIQEGLGNILISAIEQHSQTAATIEPTSSSPAENSAKPSPATIPNPLTFPAQTTPVSVADNSAQPSIITPATGISPPPSVVQPEIGTGSTVISTPVGNTPQSPPPTNTSSETTSQPETTEKTTVPIAPPVTVTTVSDAASTTPSQPTQPEKQTATINEPVSTDNDVTCSQNTIITVNCTGGNQLFKNITVAMRVSISQIRLQGQIINYGFISNGVLEENSLLTGGKITGEFKNLGKMQDFHFVGHLLEGGTLSGNIVSKGEFKNVQLAANTTISGESSDTPAILSGVIRGDAQYPAYLENVKITAKTQISGVKFGKGTTLDPQAVIELPTFNQSHQVNTKGKIIETATKFSAGLSIENSIDFVKTLTLSGSEPVKLRANIIPATEHLKQRVQFLLVAGVAKLDKHGECEVGNNTSYYILFRSPKQPRSLSLYQEPKVWIPQLIDNQEENGFFTEPVTIFKNDNLLESTVVSGAGCYYFFIGYRLAQDNTIVFDTTPLTLKVLSKTSS